MTWVFLSIAIVVEVGATLSLKVAASGQRRFYALAVPGYVIAFGLLTAALQHGMPLGVAYGIWAATGVALTAVLSKPIFGEPLTRPMAAGIGLIVSGVLLIELGASH